MHDIELKVIKLLLNRDFYKQYGNSLSNKVLSSNTKGLVKAINYLHSRRSNDNDLTTDEVYHMYESSQTTTTAKLGLIKEILNNVDKMEAMSSDVTIEIVEKMHEKEAARSIADRALAILQRSDGAMSLQELKQYVAQIDVDTIDDDIETCSTSVTDIKEAKKVKGIFKFSNGLEPLTEQIPVLSRGHFGIIFAPTNAGKSSFTAQLCVGYMQQGHKVLYFGNEDPVEDIVLNFVRTAEGKTDAEVMHTENKEWDAIRDKLVMVPAHGLQLNTLEKAIQKYTPDVVVYDQLDNVPVHGKQDRTHEALENLYQQVRQWGSIYNCLNIAISQASDDATGKLRLRTNMMANSKVGKPGAADIIIGIGMTSMDNWNRGITPCKNKVTGKHETMYMVLDPERCRYEQ